ncbi:MAG TPA: motility protein A [Clostridiales bacterium]|nr:motility protein A [Clostridiales bacterium]
MKKNFVPLIALTIGLVLVVYAISMDGGTFYMFWSVTSILITFFGSLAALLISYPFKYIKQIPVIVKKVIDEPASNRRDLITLFTDLSKKARKEGLLSLEDDIALISNPFLKRGLQMVVDGIDPETIREILELEISTMEDRHRTGEGIFQSWGELAPGFGMLGTLIGLIIMLSDLDDPSKIGAGMATALITTFYGSLLANMIFLPIAKNLKAQTDEELYTMEMMIEGVLAIQSGVNPRIVEEKLIAYLSPKERIERNKVSHNLETVTENE